MTGGVVVPTYGRSDLLDRCLSSLASLDPAPEFVVVIDGNETPRPRRTDLPPWIEFVREPNRGPAHARNTGYLEARRRGADIVCFLDDDAVVATDWFARHMQCHNEMPRAGMVGGGVANIYQTSLIAEYIHRVVFRPLRDDPGPVRMVPTLNASYKTACLDDVGLFDTALSQAGGEDVEHCWRINTTGWQVWYQPDIVAGHHYPLHWRSLIRQQKHYGRGFAQSRARHAELPGADLLSMPWWKAVGGTVPHVAREALRTVSEMGPRAVPVSIVREVVFRTSALSERRRAA